MLCYLNLFTHKLLFVLKYFSWSSYNQFLQFFTIILYPVINTVKVYHSYYFIRINNPERPAGNDSNPFIYGPPLSGMSISIFYSGKLQQDIPFIQIPDTIVFNMVKRSVNHSENMLDDISGSDEAKIQRYWGQHNTANYYFFNCRFLYKVWV